MTDSDGTPQQAIFPARLACIPPRSYYYSATSNSFDHENAKRRKREKGVRHHKTAVLRAFGISRFRDKKGAAFGADTQPIMVSYVVNIGRSHIAL